MQTGIYQHYKGGCYQVLGIAGDATNEESADPRLVVVYIALTGIHLPGPRMRIRNVLEFNELVKWPDGFTRPRFMPLGDEMPFADGGEVHHKAPYLVSESRW